jgi:glycosyltransferase involved in cell wall biosynthesis
MAPASGSVGFLVKTWPKLSETFILEEVLGLERLGQRLHLFALNPPSDAISHDAVARVRAPVVHVSADQDRTLAELATRHWRLFRISPRRYVATALRTLLRTESGRWKDFLSGARLAEALLRAGIGHLHAHFVSEPAAVAEIAAGLAGTTYSLSAHAKDIYLSRPGSLRRKLGRARFTVTCTEYNRRHLSNVAPDARVMRMYHGVDLQLFHPRLRQPVEGEPLILAVGRLREKKGFGTLIDACSLLREAGHAFHCEIVGYGEEEANLTQRIARHLLWFHVHLVGKLPRQEVIDRYARACVFVMPSQLGSDGDRDGIPNVLLEAMAMEVPVVSTPVSGIPELVRDGQTGILVDSGDPRALADAIARLLRDAPLRQRLGIAGRRAVVESFDNERNLLLLRELLASCDVCETAARHPELAPGAVHVR